MLSIGNRNFEIVRGRDISRDDIYLELSERGGKSGMAEVFYSDQTHHFVVNTFGNDIAVEAIEWMIARAKRERPERSS